MKSNDFSLGNQWNQSWMKIFFRMKVWKEISYSLLGIIFASVLIQPYSAEK